MGRGLDSRARRGRLGSLHQGPMGLHRRLGLVLGQRQRGGGLGLVAFHYGRWVYDDDERWIWIPGREWAPAWVTWRRGGERIGWAPQPPDEIYVEIRDNPRYWVFVEPRDFVSVTLWTEVEPAWRHTELLQETVIVNSTVVVRERGPIIVVNPGIEPAIIAREVGEPIRTYEVRPRILEGTAEIKDAIEVRPGEAPGELKKQE